MASVPLKFIPPQDEDVTTLHIYEGATKTGSFNLIESVPAGTYPNYIDRYTTDQAASATNWFAIQWEDSKGGTTDMSAAIQGGTTSLVAIIVQRMLLRDPTLNESIAAQEAEAVISDYFGVIDPFSVDPSTVSPKIMSGLTLLAMGWSYITIQNTSSSTQSFTAGLISMNKGTATVTNTAIQALIDQANKLLGRNYSTIMQMKEIPVSSGYQQLVAVDISRSIIEIQ